MAVKVGRTEQARAAAIAHSGSLAGEDRATDAAFDAAGVIRCADLDELLEMAELVEGTRRTGRRVGRGRAGVVTVSTGEASLIADLAPAAGLDLPPVPDAARARILETLPTMGFIANPLDPWGAAETTLAYGAVFEALATADVYDVLVLVHDFPYRSMPAEVATAIEVTQAMLDATSERPWLLPVYVSLTSGEPPPEIKAVLDSDGHGAPLLRGASEAFRAIGALARWERRRAVRLDEGPWRASWPRLAADTTAYGLDAAPLAPPSAVRALPERESLDLLRGAGLAVTPVVAVPDTDAAVEAARPLGGHDVVLKVDAPDVAHKSDLGLVRVGLHGDEAVRAAADDLFRLARGHGVDVRGLLIEPMADEGVELIVGVRRDASFGPLVMVGLGGVFAEVLDDVAIRLAPVGRATAYAMLDELRGAPLLHGVRGRPSVDRDAVADLIFGLASLADARPDIVEVDLNPVIASTDGAVAVDALVVVASGVDDMPAGGGSDHG
jgi:acyl-CoA synthetase (NDP forming)